MRDRSRSEAGSEGDRSAPPARAGMTKTARGTVASPPPGGPAVPVQGFEADFRDLMETAPVAAFVKDATGRYLYANPYLLATMGDRMGPDWRDKTDAEMWPHEAVALIRAHDAKVLAGDGPQVFSHEILLADGPHAILRLEFHLQTGDPSIGIGGIAVDITKYANEAVDSERLRVAIEQVAESIVIADREARITYVNPAFERLTGYAREEVMGQNPRLLKSDLQPPSLYEAMWSALMSGSPWVGDLVNRRKDGSLYTVEAVMSPVRDATGAIASYVAVQRDVSRERALIERSTGLVRQRALIAETIRGLRKGEMPEVTAQAICRQVASFTGMAAAQLLLFEPDGHATPIGFVVAGQAEPPLLRLSHQRSRQLRGRASEGPWIEPWTFRQDHPADQPLHGVGVHSLAHAPVSYNGQVIGLLTVQATDRVDVAPIAEALPALAEFADLAGALIGRDVADRTEVGRGRDRVASIIARRAFVPVFQPIVDLGRDAIVGYEALTRFTDGSSPEGVFAEAAAVGLSVGLETVTLDAALSAAKALPRSAWLNLNASPGLILAGEPLRSLLRKSRRHLVVEVTEHTAIADYPAFRAAMTALGPKLEFAVDDAGVGFASLRHILELTPAFVKLDRWLVADLESDEARKAMIVGLSHFARSVRCRLIAEGIETEDELAALRALDIRLGQGYLLGRPQPLDNARGSAR